MPSPLKLKYFKNCLIVLLSTFKIIAVLRYKSHTIKFILLMCAISGFSIFTELYKHCHNLIAEYFPHPRKNS